MRKKAYIYHESETMATINLGPVTGFHVGDTAPENTARTWRDTSNPRHVTKVYDNIADAWVPLGSDPPPFVRSDGDFTVSGPGVYLFFGDVAGTCTVPDGVDGPVEVRTIASKPLTFVINTHGDSFLKVMQPGAARVVFLWDAVTSSYTF